MRSHNQSRTVLSVRGVSKYYRDFVAVEDVSFDVPEGQIVALLGPNGAGKTTIMRLVTGYLPPSTGTIDVLGIDVAGDRVAAAATIGYLPENGPLYADMTPREMLHFFGEARALSGALLAERVDAVASQCDISLILDKPIGKLSKGLRQRVGMAQALLHDPPLLIMDEPTSGLDPIQIRHFREHLRQLGQHKTLVISTHILQEVSAIADRLLVISRGRLVFDGSPQDIGSHRSLEDLFYALTTGWATEATTDSSADGSAQPANGHV